MNKKNIVIALLLVLNIVLFGLCIHYKNDKPDIITETKKDNEPIKNEEKPDIKECTQTYYYIEDYNYTGETNTERFIVVDKFQRNIPEIFVIENRVVINDELVPHTGYEIKFTTRNGEKTIKEITKTDKVAFDQIQEEC